MKLVGKILWCLGIICIALSFTLYVGYVYKSVHISYDESTILSTLRSFIDSALAFAIIGVVTMVIGFVLRIISKKAKTN
jgi:hypothetical protein